MQGELPLKGALLGIGNPLLDISAHVSPEFLSKYALNTKEKITCISISGVQAASIELSNIDIIHRRYDLKPSNAILAEERHQPLYVISEI
jgi:hypothetical protein